MKPFTRYCTGDVADPVSVAILGLGRMGGLHALVVVRHIPSLRLAGLADPIPGRAAETVGRLGVDTAVYEDPLAALSDPALEACIVVTPTSGHHRLVRHAIERGLHVFCEKPLTLDPDEDERLGMEANAASLVLQVGFWRRFSPPWVAARAAIGEGVIGRPLLLRLSLWDAGLPPPGFHDLAVSGGIIVDCGVHEFDLMEWFTGQRVVRVEGHALPLAHSELEGTRDLDTALVIAHLDGGEVGVVDLSRNAGYADDIRSEVLGERGAVFVATVPSGRAWVGTADGVRDLPGAEIANAFEAGVAAELDAFARAARGERGDIPGAKESARALRIAHAAVRAVDSGRREPVLDRA
jgi:myo-inositol 2-dehydrogenase / D-chiro-inositol 1-dehydrogenase